MKKYPKLTIDEIIRAVRKGLEKEGAFRQVDKFLKEKKTRKETGKKPTKKQAKNLIKILSKS